MSGAGVLDRPRVSRRPRRRLPRGLVALAALLVACTAAPPGAVGAVGTPGGGDRRAEVQLAWLQLPGQEAPERARALASLLAAVARRTAVSASGDESPVVRVDGAELFDHPLVVLSGDDDFPPLDDEALDRLSTYLSLGGMVLIDDASGRADSAFVRRARAELSRALGGRSFTRLPSDHALYRSYYLLERAHGRVDVAPGLEAILVDGRAAVVLSANDLAGAWERDALGQWRLPVTPGGTRQREMAVRLGINIVLYSLTLDYKEDLVHLPLILERRR